MEQKHEPKLAKEDKKQDSGKEDSSLKTFYKNSEQFFEKFEANPHWKPPIANRLSTLQIGKDAEEDKVIKEKIIKETYPLADAKIQKLVEDFLDYKRKNGSNIEKKVYKNLDFNGFITRLLTQRPYTFQKACDHTLLRDGTQGYSFKNDENPFKKIGKDNNEKGIGGEEAPYLLKDYLSYDEMAISALLCVSSFTPFINNGNRNNDAKPDKPGTFQENGISIGSIGCRFEQPGEMEYKYMLITPSQNTESNGYGLNNSNPQAQAMEPFAKFYGQKFPTYKEAQEDQGNNYQEIILDKGQKVYFNKSVYKERMRAVIEAQFADANQRGEDAKKEIFLHAVGLGLGVWADISYEGGNGSIKDTCTALQLEVYQDLFGKMKTDYPRIKTINFSWWDKDGIYEGLFKNLKSAAPAGLEIEWGKRNPADKLEGKDKDKLLVMQYPWDSNAIAGNEYWMGQMKASSDPAAAACSAIGELQNPYINKEQVCGPKMKLYDGPKVILSSSPEQKNSEAQSQETIIPEKKPVISQEQTRATINELYEIVSKIAQQSQENKTSTFTLSLRNKLAEVTKETNSQAVLKGLCTRLETEANIILPPDVSDFKNARNIEQSIKTAIEQRQILLEKQQNSGLPLEEVKIKFEERNNYSYFIRTPDGNLVPVIPITTCNAVNGIPISAENTCQTGIKLKEAFTPQNQRSIHAELTRYKSDLKKDLLLLTGKMLTELTLGEFISSQNPVVQEKAKRFVQLEQYERIFDKITNDNQIKNKIFPQMGGFASLPTPIEKALSSSNAGSFLINPVVKAPDNFTRLDAANSFSLDRSSNSNSSIFANQLYAKLNHIDCKEKLQASKFAKFAGFTLEKFHQDIATNFLAKKGIKDQKEAKDILLVLKDKTNKGVAEDIKLLRTVVFEEISKWLPNDKEELKRKILDTPYRDKSTGQNMTDLEIAEFFNEFDDDLSVLNCLTSYIYLKEDQDALSYELSQDKRSPFYLPVPSCIKPNQTSKYYTDLIQIFLGTASVIYNGEQYKKGHSEKNNFGRLIEQYGNKNSLIQTIEQAINNKDKENLEDVLFTWLEKNVLNQNIGWFKKGPKETFNPETKQRIKDAFREECKIFYDAQSPAPHLDEFLFVTENNKDDIKIVQYRNAICLPLDVFCKHYDANLYKNFSQNILPKSSGIPLEKQGINVADCDNKTVLKISIKEKLAEYENNPTSLSDLLLQTTIEDKKVFSLLSSGQISELKKLDRWPEVATRVTSQLSAPEQKIFNEKYGGVLTLRLSKDQESALLNHYELISGGIASTAGQETKLRKAMQSLGISSSVISQISFNKTNFNYTVTFPETYKQKELDNLIAQINKKVLENKRSLFVPKEMATCFYKAASTGGGGLETFVGGRVAPEMTEEDKFFKTLKRLFPDLTFYTPNTKGQKGDSAVLVKFNMLSGYQILSQNPDNIYQIREFYENHSQFVLSPLEAAKVLQLAIDKKVFSTTPVELTEENLDRALDGIEIDHFAIVKLGAGYQISCPESFWDSLVKKKQIVQPNPDLITVADLKIEDKVVNDFFANISKGEIEEAKEALFRHPGLLNISSLDKYKSTPLITAITMAYAANNETVRKNCYDFCYYLLSRPDLEINRQDGWSQSTALHKTIYYKYKALKDEAKSGSNQTIKTSDQFHNLSLAIWERVRKDRLQKFFINTKNKNNEYIFSDVYLDNQTKLEVDFDNQTKLAMVSQSFWELIKERAAYNIEAAIASLEEDINSFNNISTYKITLENQSKFKRELVNGTMPGTEKTLLQLAIERGDERACAEILKNGADANKLISTPEGKITPIDFAHKIWVEMEYKNPGKFKEIIATLYHHNGKASPSYQSKLFETVEQSFWKSIQEKGIDNIGTAIHSAEKEITNFSSFLKIHPSEIKLFLGRLVNGVMPGTEKTLLQLAIESTNNAACVELLKNGANANQLIKTPEGISITSIDFANKIWQEIGYTNPDKFSAIIATLYQFNGKPGITYKDKLAEQKLEQKLGKLEKVLGQKGITEIEETTDLTSLKEQIETEKADLNKAMSSALETHGKLKKETNDFQTKVQHEQQSKQKLEKDFEQLNQEVDTLNKNIHQVQEKIESKKEEHKKLQATLVDARQEHEMSNQELDDLTKNAQTLKEEIEKAKQSQVVMKSEHATETKKLDELVIESSHLQTNLSKLQQKNSVMTSQQEWEKKTKEQLMEELKLQQAENERIAEELALMQANSKALEEEKKTLKQQESQLREISEQTRMEQDNIALLKQNLPKLQAEKLALYNGMKRDDPDFNRLREENTRLVKEKNTLANKLNNLLFNKYPWLKYLLIGLFIGVVAGLVIGLTGGIGAIPIGAFSALIGMSSAPALSGLILGGLTCAGCILISGIVAGFSKLFGETPKKEPLEIMAENPIPVSNLYSHTMMQGTEQEHSDDLDQEPYHTKSLFEEKPVPILPEISPSKDTTFTHE